MTDSRSRDLAYLILAYKADFVIRAFSRRGGDQPLNAPPWSSPAREMALVKRYETFPMKIQTSALSWPRSRCPGVPRIDGDDTRDSSDPGTRQNPGSPSSSIARPRLATSPRRRNNDGPAGARTTSQTGIPKTPYPCPWLPNEEGHLASREIGPICSAASACADIIASPVTAGMQVDINSLRPSVVLRPESQATAATTSGRDDTPSSALPDRGDPSAPMAEEHVGLRGTWSQLSASAVAFSQVASALLRQDIYKPSMSPNCRDGVASSVTALTRRYARPSFGIPAVIIPGQTISFLLPPPLHPRPPTSSSYRGGKQDSIALALFPCCVPSIRGTTKAQPLHKGE